MTSDRGPVFDGVRIGRPATGALIDAGYRTILDLPDELDELLDLHGVGPSALERLRSTFARADDAVLCVDTMGDRDDPAVLLVGGASQSMDWWDPVLCRHLADRGRHVIRFDARDTGRSSVSPVGEPSYTSDELTIDPLRVLDALWVQQAHVVGVSMGGAIGQQLAADFPDRVATLTLIATTAAGTRADAKQLPPPDPTVAAALQNPPPMPDTDDRAAWVDYLVADQRLFSGPTLFDETVARRLAEAVVGRSRDLRASMTNHWVASEQTSLSPFAMAAIATPTLVLHGTADPLFPLPHGEALAAEIAGAELIPLAGMGHEIPPPQLWDVVITTILDHTAHAT